MSDHRYTRNVFERLAVQPESPQFFDELAQLLRAREREATRRWKRTAIVFAVVALAATGAAGVLAASPAAAPNTVDVTVSCPNLTKGGLPVFSIFGEPTGEPPIDGGKIKAAPPGFRPVDGLTVETGDSLYILRLTSLVAGYQLDRRQCAPSKAKLKLGPNGLPKDVTLLIDQNEYGLRCKDVARIGMRLRITNDGYGAPIRAQLLIVRAKSAKPLAYIDWSRQKLTAWAVPGCDRTQ